jgi:hypothetical protein
MRLCFELIFSVKSTVTCRQRSCLTREHLGIAQFFYAHEFCEYRHGSLVRSVIRRIFEPLKGEPEGSIQTRCFKWRIITRLLVNNGLTFRFLDNNVGESVRREG